ncbi:MAG: glycosyltransferase [Myxococcaceae bacterium]
MADRFQVVGLTAKTPDHSHIERYHGARLLRVPVGSGDLSSRLMAFDRAVRRQLESEEYALAHFTDPFGGYAPCEQKADYGFRVIYEAQGFPSQELRYTHPQTEGDRRLLARIRRQELFCLMNADLVITGSEVTRQFIQGLGVPEDHLRVLRAPVDLGPYAPEAMGTPDGSPMRVIYLGSQVGYQGLPTLLRAMQHASRQADVRLTVVGPKHADWQAHLEDLVGELKLAGKVEFQPPVVHDDLFKVMAAADVGVVPLDDVERNRTQGGALAKASELLAAGRPVIAADLPVTRELLPEAATLFYPAGDFKELGERLIRLSNNPKLRVELGAKAREYAAQKLDASAIRGQLIDFYDLILGKPASPGQAQETEASTSVGTPTSRVGRKDVPKTDPAIRRPFEEPTDPTAAAPLGPASGAASELPVVVGEQIVDANAPAGATEPDARAGTDLPVVMGLPLREEAPAPKPSPEPEEAAAEAAPDAPTPRPAPAPPAPPPQPPPAVFVPLAGPGALAAAEARRPEPSSRASGVRAAPPSKRPEPPPRASPPRLSPAPPAAADEAQEISNDEIMEADDLVEPDASGLTLDEDAPGPGIDPWFAQLAHGYCPPEGAQFARHTPPTNFPGRDDASAVPGVKP